MPKKYGKVRLKMNTNKGVEAKAVAFIAATVFIAVAFIILENRNSEHEMKTEEAIYNPANPTITPFNEGEEVDTWMDTLSDDGSILDPDVHVDT
jgi:hypothetical protein